MVDGQEAPGPRAANPGRDVARMVGAAGVRADEAFNRASVIYARSGPIAVVFLGNAIRGNYGEAEDQIGRFAQHLVEYFDK